MYNNQEVPKKPGSKDNEFTPKRQQTIESFHTIVPNITKSFWSTFVYLQNLFLAVHCLEKVNLVTDN